jgi:NDP-sugar pyrophosphorylase family protein
MTRPRLRAVVLAAGHGMRLRPLTAELPKPLLPILGRPLLASTLERLAAAGIEATAINLHHRPEAIPAALGDRFSGMPLHYSREGRILGTLGALHPLREFLAPADLVLLVNGDSLCRWPFAELIERHLETQPLATILLSTTADFGAFGGAAIDGSGRLLAIPVDRGEAARPLPEPWVARRVFAGAHVFAPALALEAPAAPADIVRDLYRPRLAGGARIETVSTAAPWHDLGTAGRYLDAVLDWAERARRSSAAEGSRSAPVVGNGNASGELPAHARSAAGSRSDLGSWIDSSATVDPSALLERAVIEASATIEPGVVAREVLVLGGARVSRSSRLERAVIGPGVEIAARSTIADVLVTPLEWGLVPGSRAEGPLVFTPLAARPARAAP